MRTVRVFGIRDSPLHDFPSPQVTSDSLIYKTSLVYHPAPAPVMRSRPLVVPIECRYPR